MLIITGRKYFPIEPAAGLKVILHLCSYFHPTEILNEIFYFEPFFVDGRNLGSASQLDRVKSMSRDELESDLAFVALLLFRNELKPDTRSAIADLREGEVSILYSMVPKFWPAPLPELVEALGWFGSNSGTLCFIFWVATYNVLILVIHPTMTLIKLGCHLMANYCKDRSLRQLPSHRFLSVVSLQK